MSYSDETLMAFADGELDEFTRRELEQAMQHDPVLAGRVRHYRQLRANVSAAFASTLNEEVPQRQQAAAGSSKVIHLSNIRQLRTPPAPPPPVPEKRRWSWQEWGAIAGTLVTGIIAGGLATQKLGGTQQFASFDARAGSLVAEGRLEEALTSQLGGTGSEQDYVRLGVSFLSNEGVYCRSFLLPKTAGLACRSGDQWHIPVMADSAPGTAGTYRQAGNAMPLAVQGAIGERMAGKPLDGNAEKVAQMQGWQAPARPR